MVVEDNRLLREGIVTVLERHADVDIVAVAEDAAAALARVSDCKARVVLVDAGLGGYDSHDLVEDIAQAMPEARVVVMHVLPEREEIFEFVKRGASGFLARETSTDEFVRTIRAVAAGADVLPDALTDTLFSDVGRQAVTRSAPTEDADPTLTPREQEVIRLIAEGLSNKVIAARLGISTHTVKSHVRNILEKLALHSRLQVAAYVHRADGSEENPG